MLRCSSVVLCTSLLLGGCGDDAKRAADSETAGSGATGGGATGRGGMAGMVGGAADAGGAGTGGGGGISDGAGGAAGLGGMGGSGSGGASVETLPSPTHVALRGVVLAAGGIIVVGDGGNAYRRSGSTWSDFSWANATGESFTDLAVTSDGTMLFAGGEAVVVPYDGEWRTPVFIENCAGWPAGVDVGTDGTVVGVCPYYTGATRFLASDLSSVSHGPKEAGFDAKRVSVGNATSIALLDYQGASVTWYLGGPWENRASWEVEGLPGNAQYRDLAFGPAGLVVVGETGQIAVGVRNSMVVENTPTTKNLNAVDASTRRVCVSGDVGTVMTQLDGGNWVEIATGIRENLYAVEATDGRCIAVGGAGTVLDIHF